MDPLCPVIANLVCKKLDMRLAKFCPGKTWNYSRYCDDVTISGNGTFDERTHVVATIKAEGPTVNRRKICIATRTSRQMITGVVVNERPNMPRAERRKLCAMFHQAGLDRSQSTDCKNKLQGHLGLLQMIDPENSSIERYKNVIANLK